MAGNILTKPESNAHLITPFPTAMHMAAGIRRRQGNVLAHQPKKFNRACRIGIPAFVLGTQTGKQLEREP
jgi:hypothetical protein